VRDFVAAWSKVMNLDRYDLACQKISLKGPMPRGRELGNPGPGRG
jgi:hypothetical protein